MILALVAGRSSPAELRARLALDEAGQRKLLRAARPGVGEMAVLCTCHRTEIYATADGAGSEAHHTIASLLPELRASDHHDLDFPEGTAAIDHLFRVACGLDSLVIGEPQVLGQVRRAFVVAKEEGTAGPVLSNVFGRAIRLGKQVRAETELGKVASTIGAIAAKYLVQRFDGLKGIKGTIVGAGEAAADVAEALQAAGAEVRILSRTRASASKLGAKLGVPASILGDLAEALEASHFAVVALSTGAAIDGLQVPLRNQEEPLVLLDLSVPPAISIDGRSDVEIHTLEDLPGPRGPEITDAVTGAEAMLKKAVEELERWSDNRASGPLIRTLRASVETIVRDEATKAAASMGIDEEETARLEALLTRVANKILHEPTKALRDADHETRLLIAKLFGLEQK